MLFAHPQSLAIARKPRTMSITKPNQELSRDLKAAASALDDAGQDLYREAKSFAEPEFLIAIAKIAQLHEHVD